MALLLLRQQEEFVVVDAFVTPATFTTAAAATFSSSPLFSSSSTGNSQDPHIPDKKKKLKLQQQQQQQQPQDPTFSSSRPKQKKKKKKTTTIIPSYTPWQILHPESFPAWQTHTQTSTQTMQPRSLHAALGLLQQAVQRIAQFGQNDDSDEADFLLASLLGYHHDESEKNDADDDGETATMASNNRRILRLKIPVAAAGVDPLAWLHAQQQQQQQQMQQQSRNLKRVASFYMANQEDSFEVACLGAALQTDQLFDDNDDDDASTNNDKEKSSSSSSLKNDPPAWWWNDLPEDALWYGGQRFDPHQLHQKQQQPATADVAATDDTAPPPAMTHEWKAFGKAYWMLPTIELRRTQGHVMTLAVTLVLDEELSPNTNGNHLVSAAAAAAAAAAQQALPLLQSLTDRCTPTTGVPPTTNLPPVVQRDYGQPEVYEQAVAAALQAMSTQQEEKKKNDTITTTTTSCGRLEKVVLARLQQMRLDIHLSALDVLRRWKYGGIEGGHLFYLRPAAASEDSGAADVAAAAPEFFGCTPERLFQILPQPSCNGTTTTAVLRSEALAGTRQRGLTQEQDEELLRELFASPKDQRENAVTGQFIERQFDALAAEGMIESPWRKPQQKAPAPPDNKNAVAEDEGSSRSNQTACSSEGDRNETATTSTTTTGTGGGVATAGGSGEYFVRRLRHLQHICRQYSAQLKADDYDNNNNNRNHNNHGVVLQATQQLLGQMHPTPAVCGWPQSLAADFIRQYESVGFDRGFYAGPVGYIGRHAADILVAIRSGLVVTPPLQQQQSTQPMEDATAAAAAGSTVAVYAGGGLVPGSTFQGEWAETNFKFQVISSLFPASPFTLQSAPNANVAWAAAFVEELIRNGVTRFYVCPGSRSTPLVVAISRAARTHVGVVQAVSVHDERAAAFRAVGYGRGAGRPAAVITSSGTAVANLYPAVVEAGMDGVPLLLLTADRPYESRDSGANQAIDQVKVFSDTYLRWFRDILPPSEDVPVSVALSDAHRAVSVARRLRGPVHVNIQFRENLAPEAGPIRNDPRKDSETVYKGSRFTDAAGFARWSKSGQQWTKSYDQSSTTLADAVGDVAELIQKSRRGIIVVGNLRLSTSTSERDDPSRLGQLISELAQEIGFPIFAGAQSGSLRFSSPAVVLFAEHLLKCPIVAENLQPDLILQFGAPLVSTQIPTVVASAMKQTTNGVAHVLVHPHYAGGQERADPDFTVTHNIHSEIAPFCKHLSRALSSSSSPKDKDRPGLAGCCNSQLAPLVLLGRRLQSEMKSVIQGAASQAVSSSLSSSSSQQQGPVLTEPELTLALSEVMQEQKQDVSLFLSNSMPVRDAEFFFYPFTSTTKRGQSLDAASMTSNNNNSAGPKAMGTNRGASGIDGIISSAMGFAEATEASTTLVIGDLATLHDLNSMHGMGQFSNDAQQQQQQGTTASSTIMKRHALTTIVVNNNGGGIFSFLPIAKHGADVAFEDFFGTPTTSFSFEKGAQAFGVPYRRATDLASFSKAYRDCLGGKSDTIVEAVVVGRETNVAVHQQISESVSTIVSGLLSDSAPGELSERLPATVYSHGSSSEESKTLVLLHGWMGDKSEWDSTAPMLVDGLSDNWTILSVDLPGHGSSPQHESSELDSIKAALGLGSDRRANDLSVSSMAKAVLKSLHDDYSVKRIDSIAGYSLGGRVALEMKRLCSPSFENENTEVLQLMDDGSDVILLSASPGQLLDNDENKSAAESADSLREKADDRVMSVLNGISNKMSLTHQASSEDARLLFDGFLAKWYGNPIWGRLKNDRRAYSDMLARRSFALGQRGRDLASCVSQCSPARNRNDNWKYCPPERTLFLAGSSDPKYSSIGQWWSNETGITYREIAGAGHALLVESPTEVASRIVEFVTQEGSIRAHSSVETMSLAESKSAKLEPETTIVDTSVALKPNSLPAIGDGMTTMVHSLDFEAFSIDLFDESSSEEGVLGIGWGESAEARESSVVSRRNGFVVQVYSDNGQEVGLGEVSPLKGLHKETLDEARDQLVQLKKWIESDPGTEYLCLFVNDILALEGRLGVFLDGLAFAAGTEPLLPSVRSGLEMALLSLSSQGVSSPIHQALQRKGNQSTQPTSNRAVLPLNGLVVRGSGGRARIQMTARQSRSFPSLKVKVGFQSQNEDSSAIVQGFQRMDIHGRSRGKIRADANRAWDDNQAREFAASLDGLDVHSLDRIEFIEEPLQKILDEEGNWSLGQQVMALERWYRHTSILYGLDESIGDLVEWHGGRFDLIRDELASVFQEGRRGCGALVLKPALIGMELSMRIARYARSELGLGVVFSSSFDSGIGLAHTALLGFLSDQVMSAAPTYPHGLGTFTMLRADTLTPPFASYASDMGLLNIPSLSRALYGLSLDELRPSLETYPSMPLDSKVGETASDSYEATTATSPTGQEISVVVSFPLPFSAGIGAAKFTDLPQQSRWSPWISSVAYKGAESEWTLNVRGIPLKWRATSNLLTDPWPGIEWQSVSGVQNRGSVEFVPDSPSTCHMNVRMTFVPPRLLRPLFQGTSVFLEDFLREKVLKWSLEMFRDAVKADLALERGDVELGDALYEAVEGKASAIEATLEIIPSDRCEP